MRFHQLLDPDLGCACYVVGDGGEAVVVDPGLDVERILRTAAADGLEITHVVETHVHADHVSGRELLAARTGATVHLPAGGEADPGAGAALHPGDAIAAGAVRLQALPAPGHRPEHLVLAVSDLGRDGDPWLLLTGDSLLIGDVARPDLAVDPHEGAHALHATLRRLLALGDGVEVWPGHVGGSLCGGPGLSPKPSSTVGFERRANPQLREPDAAAFAAGLVAQLPPRPPTVTRVVAANRRVRPAPGAAAPVLDGASARATLEAGAVLVDGRDAEAFDAGHVPGSLNLPLTGRSLGTRAGWVLDPAGDVIVAAADEPAAHELARRLRAVGFERVAVVAGGSIAALRGPAPTAHASLSVDEAAALLAAGAGTLVDVRDDDEWRAAHVPGSLHVPLRALRDGADRLPRVPLAVACASGPRASFAASWLRREGHEARRVRDGGIGHLLARRPAGV
jgi:glyoxylase-like metal-dependent hydrolase (beta-lactamase superfamily II)/rhodanese-related sulfurtransferase